MSDLFTITKNIREDASESIMLSCTENWSDVLRKKLFFSDEQPHCHSFQTDILTVYYFYKNKLKHRLIKHKLLSENSIL